MHHGRCSTVGGPRRVGRNGILFIGAFREVLVVCLVVGLVLFALCEAKSVLQLHSSAQTGDSSDERTNPVLSLDFDEDQHSLLVHSWPEYFEEIHLDSQVVSKRVAPQGLTSVATSAKNSTTIMLTQWGQEGLLRHAAYILRQGEFVMSEEIDFGELSIANAYISDDGSVAMVISHEGACVGWELTQPKPTRWEYRLPHTAVTKRLSPDGRTLFVLSTGGVATIRDARTGEPQMTLPKIIGNSRGVVWSGDGRRLALSDPQGGLYVIDVASGKVVWKYQLDFLFGRSMSISKDGNLLAVSSFDKQIRLWDLSDSASQPHMLVGHESIITDMAFNSANTKLVSGSLDGSICEWSLATNQRIRQIR